MNSFENLLKEGLCRTRNGKILPVKDSLQVGISDDEIALTEQEVRRIIDAVPKEDLRNRLLIKMMFATGARVSLVCRMWVNQIDWGNKRIHIPAAKQGDPTDIYVSDEFLADIVEYIHHFKLGVDDYFFSVRYVNRHGFNLWVKTDKPIGRKNAEEVLKKYAEKAGVQKAYFDPKTGERRWRVHNHTARITFASLAYEISKDILLTSRLIGHKSTAMTEKVYIKVSKDRRREVSLNVQNRLFDDMKDVKREVLNLCPARS